VLRCYPLAVASLWAHLALLRTRSQFNPCFAIRFSRSNARFAIWKDQGMPGVGQDWENFFGLGKLRFVIVIDGFTMVG